MILLIPRRSNVNAKTYTIQNIKDDAAPEFQVDLISDAYYTTIDKRSKVRLSTSASPPDDQLKTSQKSFRTNESNSQITQSPNGIASEHSPNHEIKPRDNNTKN